MKTSKVYTGRSAKMIMVIVGKELPWMKRIPTPVLFDMMKAAELLDAIAGVMP